MTAINLLDPCDLSWCHDPSLPLVWPFRSCSQLVCVLKASLYSISSHKSFSFFTRWPNLWCPIKCCSGPTIILFHATPIATCWSLFLITIQMLMIPNCYYNWRVPFFILLVNYSFHFQES